MDFQAVLSIVETWPVEDRVKLVREVWERLSLSEEWKAELDRRLADDDSSPEDAISWDEVRAEAIARARV